MNKNGRRRDLSPGGRGIAFGLIVLLMLTPAAAAGPWWWPTQGTWIETDHLWMAPPDPWDSFVGSSVALDGDTLVVGGELGVSFGHPRDWAYVFERGDEGEWHRGATLHPEVDRPADNFGVDVAVDEESGVIVVGNPHAATATVFERTAEGDWERTATLSQNEKQCVDGDRACLFGVSVAVSGETVAVAGYGLFVFEKVGRHWEQTAQPVGSVKVALEGDTLVAQTLDTEHRSYRVYERTADGWEEEAVLDPAAHYDNAETIPTRVDLSADADKLILGAPGDRRVYGYDMEDQGLGLLGAVGAVWIYERIDGEWVQTADLPNPDPGPNEVFGAAVAITGNRAIVGADSDGQNGGSGAGAVYIFEKRDGSWLLTAKLRNHDSTASEGAAGFGGGDWFGYAVDASASTVVAGAPFDDNRRDGLPDPLNDDGDIPPCTPLEAASGCDDGEDAGSVYVFETIQPVASTVSG